MSIYVICLSHTEPVPKCRADYLTTNSEHNLIIISGLVTVLDRPGRGAPQMEKSPRSSWATQFLTVAHDGHVPLTFLSEWGEFPSAACLERGEKNLMTGRVTMLLKSRVSLDMLPFSSVTRKYLQFGT